VISGLDKVQFEIRNFFDLPSPVPLSTFNPSAFNVPIPGKIKINVKRTNFPPERSMSDTIAQMSKDELKEMIANAVEQKLLELLGDPDEGLELRKSIRERLVKQQKQVAAGDWGESFQDVIERLSLD
jgi:hypothetical protein